MISEMGKIVESMNLDDCKTTLEHINKELHSLSEGNSEKLKTISNLCLLIREKLTKLTSQNDSQSNNSENTGTI